MTRATTTIPFHDLTFIDDIAKLRDVEARWKTFLKRIRQKAQVADLETGKITEEDAVEPYYLVNDSDLRSIKRRATRLLERVHSSTGMYHLSEENRARLTPLRGGLPVTRVTSEHEADEIAAALHAEMPWMARATEEVWHGLRASARDGLPGVRFNPLVLNGSPGIGKSYWTRRLAHHLAVPTTMIEATGEPATFSLVGLQKGWGSAGPGKLMQTVLSARHAGPLVIVDEIEKAGEMHSNKGVRHTLTDGLLPLLERMTAARWDCPFFQIKCDMSWVNWVMTANSLHGFPEPLQSRCVVLDLPDLTPDQLRQFAITEGARRGLPDPALAALVDVFDCGAVSNARLSLRTVARMLDRAKALAKQPMLH
ncbi:AAA family ATPase [Aliiroseovarius sp. S2029]|uniref:AAA family ATPase n=1 Tax=Aliiroseovarius sp. S2029 TaxID=2936988 RepID=UPI0020C06CB0|nr:AAA family ATPase [Aliiroseovarius sp. S2029]MCK8482978.1 AAA family ATPase [Aliiroseovarius sp. S2029]